MNSQSAYERWLLARIAGPSSGTFSAPETRGTEDHPQERTDGDPLQEPVEQAGHLPLTHRTLGHRVASIDTADPRTTVHLARRGTRDTIAAPPPTPAPDPGAPPVPVHPLAEPFVADGDAESPRGRVGVLLSHGFTGSPASMKPWAEYLAVAGVRRLGAPPPRPRHHLAGDEQDHLGRLVRRDRARLRGPGQPGRHRRRLRALDGRRAWRCASPPTTPTGSPAWSWSTRR